MMVPPVLVDGLTVLVIAALNPPDVGLGEGLPPLPQAASTSAVIPLNAASPMVLRLLMRGNASCSCFSVSTRLVVSAHGGRLPASRVERVAQPVTEEVEGQHGDEDRKAWDDHEHRVDRVVPAAYRVREHPAPGRLGRD